MMRRTKNSFDNYDKKCFYLLPVLIMLLISGRLTVLCTRLRVLRSYQLLIYYHSKLDINAGFSENSSGINTFLFNYYL